LAFKVLHDVQKLIVYIWIVVELILDSIEISEGVGDIEWSSSLW